jgi:hypothetical protein
MTFYTTTLSAGSLTISTADAAMMISIEPNSGSSCTVLGSLPFKGLTPVPIVLDANQVLTVSAQSPSSPLNGLTITHVSGTVDIIIGV